MNYAVIVAHGQPSDPAPAESALAAYAREINALADNIHVSSATLGSPGKLEAVLDKLPDGAVIYPLFMSSGWFVTRVLPERLGRRTCPILPPLGSDPQLPDLVEGALTDTLNRLGWAPSETDLVLAAHGSGRSRNPARIASAFAAKIGGLINFNSLHVGFVEEDPSIAEAASGLSSKSLCLPFFACVGGHVLEDIPQALDQAGFSGEVLPVVGELPSVKPQIAARLKAHFEDLNTGTTG